VLPDISVIMPIFDNILLIVPIPVTFNLNDVVTPEIFKLVDSIVPALVNFSVRMSSLIILSIFPVV
jgi:hypothetical protein